MSEPSLVVTIDLAGDTFDEAGGGIPAAESVLGSRGRKLGRNA